ATVTPAGASLLYRSAHPLPADVEAVVHRQPDLASDADDVRQGDRAEAAGVLGVVPIVAHHEHPAGGHLERQLLVAAALPLDLVDAGRAALDHLDSPPGPVGGAHREAAPVAKHLGAANLDGIAGQAQDALDEYHVAVVGIDEKRDVAVPRRAAAARAVDPLVRE